MPVNQYTEYKLKVKSIEWADSIVSPLTNFKPASAFHEEYHFTKKLNGILCKIHLKLINVQIQTDITIPTSSTILKQTFKILNPKSSTVDIEEELKRLFLYVHEDWIKLFVFDQLLSNPLEILIISKSNSAIRKENQHY